MRTEGSNPSNPPEPFEPFRTPLDPMIDPIYSPNPDRYDGLMQYRRCGRSGILMSALSLGF